MVHSIDTCFEYLGTFVGFFFRYTLWITVAELLVSRIWYLSTFIGLDWQHRSILDPR
jgi:hypothetical protein